MQYSRYSRTSMAKCRRGSHRRKKGGLIVLATGLAAVISIAIWAMMVPWGTVASGETSGSLAAATKPEQDGQSGRPVVEIPKLEVDTQGPAVEWEYDYARPVPESLPVEDSYFDDAVFIGDSRTEGLILYTGLSNAISYTNKGLMVDTVFTKPVINMDGEKLSVMDALRRTDFSKVYIMLGINETGWPYNSVFIEKYGQIIDEIRQINPDATIYVQEILPVTEEVSQTHSYVKNEKIDAYNTLIRQMAEEKQVYYIDAGKAVEGADGSLPEEAAMDGIHLKQPYCEKWLAYLKTHTVTEIGG